MPARFGHCRTAPWRGLSVRATSTAATAATTLAEPNTACQPNCSAISPALAPPTIWPRITAEMKRPSAIGRVASSTRSPIAASDSGMMPPAIRPVRMRKASRLSKSGANTDSASTTASAAVAMVIRRDLPRASPIGPRIGWPTA